MFGFREMEKMSLYPALKRSEKNYSTSQEVFDLMHISSNWYKISHDGWHLPGTFTKHDWCGDWFYRGCLNIDGHANTECDGKGFLKTFEKCCFRADCEKCMKKWLGRSSNKGTRRIEKYQDISKKSVKHIIISVPKWDYGLTKKEQAKKAMKILKEVRCDGGAMIYHPFRYNKDYKEWYYSPHFHVLGFGWIDQVVEAYDKHGYIIKNLGVRDSVFGTFYYQLSHAGIKKHNHALTWFGDLSYCNLKLPDYDKELEKCPYCDKDLVLLYLIGPFFHKPPDLDCEIFIDTDDFAEIKYEDREYVEPTYDYHSTEKINSVIEQLLS